MFFEGKKWGSNFRNMKHKWGYFSTNPPPQTKFVFEAKILKSHEILEALTKKLSLQHLYVQFRTEKH